MNHFRFKINIGFDSKLYGKYITCHTLTIYTIYIEIFKNIAYKLSINKIKYNELIVRSYYFI